MIHGVITPFDPAAIRMLSFLLFAGALHIDWSEMHRRRWAILILSTVGVLASTAIVGFGFSFQVVAGLMGSPFRWSGASSSAR